MLSQETTEGYALLKLVYVLMMKKGLNLGNTRSILGEGPVGCVPATAWPDRSQRTEKSQRNVPKNKEKMMLWIRCEVIVIGFGEFENN